MSGIWIFALSIMIAFAVFSAYKIVCSKGFLKWIFLPFLYVDVFALYIIFMFEVYKGISGLGNVPTLYFVVLQIGIMLSIIPVVFMSIRLSQKYSRRPSADELKRAEMIRGTLIHLKDMRMTINRQRVLEVTFQVDDGGATEESITKEVLVPLTMMHYFTPHKSYELYRLQETFYIDILGKMF